MVFSGASCDAPRCAINFGKSCAIAPLMEIAWSMTHKHIRAKDFRILIMGFVKKRINHETAFAKHLAWMHKFLAFSLWVLRVSCRHIMQILCLVALPVLLLSSCKLEKREGSAKATDDEAVKKAEAAPALPPFDVKNASSLVGQRLDVVKSGLEAAEIRFRVIELDGEPMIRTMDYSPERLNFKVKAGVITEVSKG
jgi:hypothetical protein